MKIEKVINIEDTILKHIAIKRALNKCGVILVDQEETAEKGIEQIEKAIKEENPYDLLVLDMHFCANGINDKRAGLYVIEQLKNKNIQIPIVVCSSIRFENLDRVEACIYYNEWSGDLDFDIKEIVEKLRESDISKDISL